MTAHASRRPETFSARILPLTFWRGRRRNLRHSDRPRYRFKRHPASGAATSMTPLTVVAEMSLCDPLAVMFPEAD